MDGMPVGGSPFPVFFSPPTIAEVAASLLAAARMGSSPDAVLQVCGISIFSTNFRLDGARWNRLDARYNREVSMRQQHRDQHQG